jgi:hypothetical protein
MFSSPARICFSGPKEVCVPASAAGGIADFSPSATEADAVDEAEADVTGSEAPAVPTVRIRENVRLSMAFTFLDRCVTSGGIDKAGTS